MDLRAVSYAKRALGSILLERCHLWLDYCAVGWPVPSLAILPSSITPGGQIEAIQQHEGTCLELITFQHVKNRFVQGWPRSFLSMAKVYSALLHVSLARLSTWQLVGMLRKAEGKIRRGRNAPPYLKMPRLRTVPLKKILPDARSEYGTELYLFSDIDYTNRNTR